MYNFDEIVDRRGTNSIKWDFAAERGAPPDALPLWVADTDFRTVKEVREAIIRTAEHGIYGYTEVKQPYYDALCNWFETRFKFYVDRKHVVKVPGVVFALATAVKAYTLKGDFVLIQRPVYYPFTSVVEVNGRQVANAPLKYSDGRYYIDFDELERVVVDRKVKLMLLCSPHNPVGRVWERQELVRIGEICLKHGVTVVSDEIHCDFTYPGHAHTPFASISPELAGITVTCTAPSKTFNLAGLHIGNVIISDPELRRKFIEEYRSTGLSQLNAVGLAACQAAYEYGGVWLDECKAYLLDNLNYLRERLSEIPGVEIAEPEGTYLVWFKVTGVPPGKQNRFMLDKAKLWLDDGAMFGEEGAGFQRINIACPRALLKEAAAGLAAAMEGYVW